MTQDMFDKAEVQMGFQSEEPTHYLRLKDTDAPEIVIFQGLETVEASQREKEGGFHSNGKTIEYRFTSPFTGIQRTHRANGQGLLIGFKTATVPHETDGTGQPIQRKVEVGETVSVKRTGLGGDTRYMVIVLSTDEIESAKQEWVINHPDEQELANSRIEEEEKVDINDIPF